MVGVLQVSQSCPPGEDAEQPSSPQQGPRAHDAPHTSIYHADLCPVSSTLSHPMWVARGVAFGDGASSGYWACSL